ncbi:MAG: T9SS type A sorting domain-containing protein, partial [Bacteroidia bacterium]|nr:T9SS type A sorting domain-containing protein [Bacteroidia bacterium]
TSATSNARYFIYNSGVGFNGITFNMNAVSGFSSAANTTGAFYGIYNPSNCSGNLDITGNSMSSLLLGSTTGAAYITNNSGIITGSTTIQNNSCTGLTFTATSAPFYGIFNGGSSPTNIIINGNSLSNALISTSTSARYGVQNTANSINSISLDNNSVNNYTSNLNTTAAFYGVYNTGSADNISLSGNTLNALMLGSTTGTNYMVYNTGTLTGVANLNNNTVSNGSFTSTGAGTFYGIFNQASSSMAANLNSNAISNSTLSMPSAASYLVYNNAASATVGITNVSMNGNTINGLIKNTLSSPNYGVFNNLASSSNLSLSNNTFSNSAVSATSGVTYIVYNTGSVSSAMNLNGNRVASYTSSLNATGDFYGVYNSAICQGNISMSSNLFQNSLIDGVSNNVFLIRNNASNSGLSMNSNSVTGCNNSSVTSGVFYGVWSSGNTLGPLSMSGNNLTNNSSNATTGNTYLIYNSAVASNSIAMNNNQLGQVFTNNTTDYSGDLFCISNVGGNTSSSLTVNNNTFSGFTYNGLSGTGNIYFINNTNNNNTLDISGNNWSSITIKHSGNQYLMNNPSATQSILTVNNNSVTGYTRTGNAGSMYIYYSNGSSPASSNQIFSGNNFANITATLQGTGSFYGLYSADGITSPFPKKQFLNNNISNIDYNGLGFFYGYYLDFLGDGNSSGGSSVNSNTITSVSYGGPVYGIQIGMNCSPNYTTTVFANSIQSLTTSGANSEIHGVQLGGTGNVLNFYKNKISDLTANGILGGAEGITVSNAANTNILNNVIGNINTPVTSYSNGVNGINIAGGNTVNVYYNTVNLNAVSSGSFFASSAIYASSAVNLNLRNNIFINNSTPSGAGLVCAYRRTSSSLANYSISSNNNVFYAGIPSNSKLIYFDGNSYQNLPQFQNLVSPRESASATENTNFLSTVGSSTNFLHVDNTIPSVTENGAQNVAGISDDIDADVRQGNPGYSGTGSAPDIGADEYNQSLVPCSGVNSGTAIVPSSAIKCSGNEVYLVTTGQTQAGGISYQWKIASNPGGPYTNVIGGNASAYNTPTLAAGIYYYIMVTTCANNSQTVATNELTVSVNASPTGTASAINGTLCAGETLSLTAGSATGTNYLWLGPNNFTSTLQSPLVNSVVANSSGTYSLFISTANCTSSPVFVNALVSPTPPGFSLTPSSASLCIGNSQTITASLPITSPTLTAGSQSGQNSLSNYPAPYSIYYGGQKMQILVLANELSAAGFTIGTPINSIQFPVVSKGSNWGTVVNSCQNFMVGMKSTTLASLTGFESNIVNVVTPINYTPSVGYNNVHNFAAPFVWDGTSNLVIETVFSNSIVGTSGNGVVQNNHPTGFLSTLVYRADNQSAATIAAATNSNVNIGFVRPDFKLNGSPVGTYSWGPVAGLNTSNSQTVVASPTISTVYSATLSNGSCISSANTSITVVLNPTISIASTANTVCSGNNATLTAGGAATYTWFNGVSSSSVIVSPFGNTTYSVVGTNPACPNASTSIQLISAPALTLTALPHPGQLCAGESSTLTVSGASSYTWTGGENNDTVVVTPPVTTSYTVSANSGPGCWTSKVVNVKVNPLPLITIVPPSATVCPGDFLSLEAMGVLSFTWQETNSNSPILMINPAQSTIYNVMGVDLNGCQNTASVGIIVDPCESVAEHEGDKALKIYPNPSSGLVNLDFGSNAIRTVLVTNSMGQKVFETVLTESAGQINLGHLSKGVYFISVDENKNSTKHKLIID